MARKCMRLKDSFGHTFLNTLSGRIARPFWSFFSLMYCSTAATAIALDLMEPPTTLASAGDKRHDSSHPTSLCSWLCSKPGDFLDTLRFLLGVCEGPAICSSASKDSRCAARAGATSSMAGAASCLCAAAGKNFVTSSAARQPPNARKASAAARETFAADHAAGAAASVAPAALASWSAAPGALRLRSTNWHRSAASHLVVGALPRALADRLQLLPHRGNVADVVRRHGDPAREGLAVVGEMDRHLHLPRALLLSLPRLADVL
eukprot:CAMPEP_0176290622 /NCGR_PEP_ID=MMETSP0121_2-20121125/55122_1 /TAXON_ID=160619 /ORGANISM="Kryptoperidinium foliaceum, Strain CCMP 1326" /LENGTH=262 /DNA_ID=CAMNT_0017631427 /DNA_START=57 /DNA_END=841 /DNA_ORIENTATION=+